MRILVVDGYEVVREGMVAALSRDPLLEVVGVAADGVTGLRRARQCLPDVVTTDLRLADMPGTEFCRRIRALLPSSKVVVLSSYLSEEAVRQALDAGAAAYVTMASGVDELRRTIDRLGAAYADTAEGPSQIVKRLHELSLAGADAASRPTPQQLRVLELVAEGLTNDEIGQRLYISESTVRFHLQKLKSKVGARNKTQLIVRAIRIGLLPPAEDEVASCVSLA